MKPIRFLLWVSVLGVPRAYAQAPLVVSTQPAANAPAAPGTGPVVVTFAGPAGAAGLRVVGNRYAGRRPGPAALAGNTATLAPAPAFGPGELVRVSVPGGGAAGRPYVYEFRAAAAPAAARFGARQVFPSGVLPVAAAPGDFDGDGDLDLAIGNAGQGGQTGNGLIHLYRNNGQGQFTAYGVPNDATLNSDVEAADVDNDGDLDLVYDSEVITEMNWGRNDGQGNFTLVIANIGLNLLTTADFNGDGHPDYAATSSNQADLVVGLYDAAALGFYTAVRVPLGPSPGKPAVLDLDGDGDLDLAVPSVGSANPQVYVRLNNGAGQFAAAPTLPMPGAGDLATGDVDNDGRPDLVMIAPVAGTLFVRRNLGGGAFAPAQVLALPAPVPRYLVLADLNGDGLLDAAVGQANTPSVQVLLGTGTGAFTLGQVLTTSALMSNLYAADLNGDGRLDLLTCVPQPSAVNIFFNQAPVTAASAPALPTLQLSPNPVADGRLHLSVPAHAAGGGTGQADLYNVLGQAVRRLVLPANGAGVEADLDLRGLPAGAYVLRVSLGGRQYVRRVDIH